MAAERASVSWAAERPSVSFAPVWARRLAAALVGLTFASIGLSAAAPGGKRPSAQSNQQLAIRDARALLKRLVLPPAATASAVEPAGDGGLLAHPAVGAATTPAIVDRHGWWRVPMRMESLLAFVESHRPRGSRQTAAGETGRFGKPTSEFVTFTWPAVAGRLGTRALVVELAGLPAGETGVRADAEVVWIIPRPLSEQIPSGARELDVSVARPGQPPSSAFTFTDSAKIKQIAALIDRLPIVQPGAVACPDQPADAARIAFTFRTGSKPAGTPLAQASELDDPNAPATACDAMTLTIRGSARTPLLAGGAVIRAAGHILGVTFTNRSTR